MSSSCLYLGEGNIVTSSLFTFYKHLHSANVLQYTKEVITRLNPPKTKQIQGSERVTDCLHQLIKLRIQPAQVSASDGLPANLPEVEDTRQDQAVLLGCHIPCSYSAAFFCFIFKTPFRHLSKHSSPLYINWSESIYSRCD